MRPVTVMPTLMLLPDALDLLVATDNQLACVIDEYGGFAGVLTMEDLAMEIVGEITDEHDADTRRRRRLPKATVSGSWTAMCISTKSSAPSAVDLPRGDVETIAGMLIAELGALPAEGETRACRLCPSILPSWSPTIRRVRRLEVDVLRVERHVPTQLRVRLIEADPVR